jgi:hypothetical protein
MSRLAKFTLFAFFVATVAGLSFAVWQVFAPAVEREVRAAAEPSIAVHLQAVSIADLLRRSH